MYALPGIQLVDLLPTPVEFRYRLVGTREVEMRGFDPTGRPVADGFIGTSVEEVFDNYRSAVAARAPMCTVGSFLKVNDVPVTDISIFLPRSSDGGTVVCVMVYSYQRSLLEGGP